MKKILSAMILVMATSPAYAMSHKQRIYQHRLHKENKILQRWMMQSEKNCTSYRNQEFYMCYVKSLSEIHAKSRIKFLPETEKHFRVAIKPPRNTIID